MKLHRRILCTPYFLPFAFFPFEDDVFAGLAVFFFAVDLAAALFLFADDVFGAAFFTFPFAEAFASFLFPLSTGLCPFADAFFAPLT